MMSRAVPWFGAGFSFLVLAVLLAMSPAAASGYHLCGAPCRDGHPCHNVVHGPGRCWLHQVSR